MPLQTLSRPRQAQPGIGYFQEFTNVAQSAGSRGGSIDQAPDRNEKLWLIRWEQLWLPKTTTSLAPGLVFEYQCGKEYYWKLPQYVYTKLAKLRHTDN